MNARRIPGYERAYLITRKGMVYSIRRKRYIKSFMRERRGGNLCPSVALYDHDGVRRVYFVHRLVALTYIDNPDNKEEVNHKDGDTTNHRHTNLEWMTRSENQKHAWDNGLIGARA